jgi:hypothetical protein
VSLPDDSSITGTRSISVRLQSGRATDTDSTLVAVRDDSETADFTLSEPVVAGETATASISSSVDETAVLTAYSPDAETVAFNDSVALSSAGNTQKDLTIDSPGTYVVRLSVPSVGAVTEVVDVEPASGPPSLTTGTDTATEAGSFGTSEGIYIMTNQSGMTATIVGEDGSYDVALDSTTTVDGETVYYGVLSSTRPAGTYLVRLDSKQATSVNDTIVEVTS